MDFAKVPEVHMDAFFRSGDMELAEDPEIPMDAFKGRDTYASSQLAAVCSKSEISAWPHYLSLSKSKAPGKSLSGF